MAQNQWTLCRMVDEDCFILFCPLFKEILIIHLSSCSRPILLKPSSKKLFQLTTAELMKTEVTLTSVT